MHYKTIFTFLSVILISCGGSSASQEKSDAKKAPTAENPLRYNVHFMASRTQSSPPDEINIDTNGLMVIYSQQQMVDGKWKKPKGLAKIEPDDADTLKDILSDDLLYSILEEDVIPPCSEGADYTIRIDRIDTSLVLALKTNTCAIESNTLSGRQRALFKRLLLLFERMRPRYRPQFYDKG